MSLRSRFNILGLLLGLLLASSASACPDIDGLADLNCDHRLIILTFGDSITYGTGDNQRLHGYPGRLSLALPHAQIVNLGLGGETSYRGRSRAAKLLPRYTNADYFILLEGVNDFWLSSHSSSGTKSNLLTIIKQAKKYGIVTLLANLTPIGSSRSRQRPWVTSVNSRINPYRQIDFYSLGTSILNSDSLHPNGHGYQRMADLALSKLNAASNANRIIDTDNDDLSDAYEISRGMNPLNADSDGDGVTDGDEVRIYRTNPLSTDSDNDGLEDGYEVNTLHSNPADARPGAPHLTSLTVLPPD